MIEISICNEFIDIKTLNDSIDFNRLPNKLIWDINSFLSKKYNLYEFYFSNKQSEVCIKQPGILSFNKHLLFSQLQESLIYMPCYNEHDCKIEFENHKDEIGDYNDFLEIMLMEFFNEINYVAVEDISIFAGKIMSQLKSKIIWRKRTVIDIVKAYADVSVCMVDNCYINITTKEPDVLAEVIKIAKKYQ